MTGFLIFAVCQVVAYVGTRVVRSLIEEAQR